MEAMLENLKSELSGLEKDANELKAKNSDQEEFARTLELKGDELTNTIESLYSELKEKTDDYEKLMSLFKQAEQKELGMHENLKTKETDLTNLEGVIKELEGKYTSLAELYDARLTDVHTREDDLLAVNTTLKSKEEAIQQLLNQVGTLNDEKVTLIDNESSLSCEIKNYAEQMNDITLTLNSKVNEINTLQSRITELENERDLLKSDFSKKLEELDSASMLLDEQYRITEQLRAEIEQTRLNYENTQQNISEHMRSKDETLMTLEGQLRTLENDYGALQQRCTDLEADIFKREEDVQVLNSSLRAKEESIQVLVGQVQQLGEEKESLLAVETTLNNSIAEYMQQIDAVSLDVSSKDAEIQRLASEMSTLQNDRDSFKLNYEKTFDELRNASSLLEQQDQTAQQLKDELQKTEQERLHESQNINENLKSKESALTLAEENMKGLNGRYASLQEHCQQLEANVLRKEEDVEAINSNLRSKEESIQVLVSQIESLTHEKEELLSNETSLNTTVTEYSVQIEDITKDLQTKGSDVDRLTQEIGELNQQRDALKNECDKSKEELMSASNLIEQQNAVTEQLKDELQKSELNYQKAQSMVDTLKSKESTLASLEGDLEELQGKYITLQEHCSKVELDVSRKSEDIEAVTSNLHSKEESIHVLVEQIDSLTQEKELLMNNESSLNTTVTDYEEKIGAISTDLQSRSDDISRLKEEIAELQMERDLLKEDQSRKVDELTNTVQMLDQQNKVTEQLRQELQKTELNYHEAQGTVENLTAKESMLTTLQESMKDLHSQHTGLQERCNRLEEDISTKEEYIEAVNSNLRSKEESVLSLLNQVETLKGEKEALLKNEESLNAAMNESIKQFDDITGSLQTKENEINMYNEELDQLQNNMSLLQSDYEKKMEELTATAALLEQQHSITDQIRSELQKTEVCYQQASNANEDLKTKESSLITLQENMRELHEKNSAMQEYCDKLEGDIIRKDEDIQAMSMNLKSKEESVQVLVAQIETLATEKISLQESEASLRAQIDDYKTQLADNTETMKMKDDELQKLGDVIRTLEEEKTVLKMEHERTVNELLSATSSFEQQHTNVQELSEQLKQAEMNYKDNLCKAEEYSTELREQLVALQQSETTLQEHLDSKNKELNDLLQKNEEEKELLKGTLSSTEQQMFTKMEEIGKNYETQLYEKEGEVNAITRERETLKQQMGELICELDDAVQEKVGLNVGLVEKESELAKMQAHYQSILEEKDVSVNDLRVNLKVNTEENVALHLSLVEKSELISELQESLTKTRQELDQVQSSLQSTQEESEKASTQSQNDKAKEIKEFKIKAAKKIKDMNKELKAANLVIGEFKEKEIQLQNEKNELQNASQLDQTSFSRQLEAEKQTNAELLTTIEEMKSINSDLELATNSYGDKCTGLEEELSRLQILLTAKDEHIVQFTTEVENCRAQIEMLEGRLSEQYSRFEEVLVDTAKVGVKKEIEAIPLSEEEVCQLSLSQLSPGEMIDSPSVGSENIVAPFVEANAKSAVGGLVHTVDDVISSGHHDSAELQRQIEELKEYIRSKDADFAQMKEACESSKQQYDTLKEKTARNMKKFLAMKKVLAGKESEIQTLNSSLNESHSQPRTDDDQAEVEANNELLKTLGVELENFKQACKNKDAQINELNGIISQLSRSAVSPASTNGNNESSDGSAPEASITTSAQELEWDPSDTNKSPGNAPYSSSIDEPLCTSMDSMFVEMPRTSMNDIQVLIPPSPDMNQSNGASETAEDIKRHFDSQLLVKAEENQKLADEIEQLTQALNKQKKNNKLLKKAQLELAKEVEQLQEQPKEMEFKMAEVNDNMTVLQGQLRSSLDMKTEIEAKMMELRHFVVSLLNEEEMKRGDIARSIDRLSKVDEIDITDNQLEVVREQFSALQESYTSITSEMRNISRDCQNLVEQKLEKEMLIETLNTENQRLVVIKTQQADTFVKTLGGLSTKLQDDEYARMFFAECDADTPFEESLHSIVELLKKEKSELKEIFENEKLIHERKCAEEMNEEIEGLKKELDVIIEKQNESDKNRESERTLKDQALDELELLREQLATSIMELQYTRESSQECENKLLGEIERELFDVKGKLQTANAMKEELEAGMKCEELLKQQFMKENEILKSEINGFKEEQQQQSETSGDVEEVRKHKDLVIKKLKLKLKKEMTDKEKLIAESANTSTQLTEKESVIENLRNEFNDSSVVLSEKDNTIHNLENELDKKDTTIQKLENELDKKYEEKETYVTESFHQLTEKEDLITALKDELTWLKESMSPLVTKAENTDKLSRENQNLKYCVETKENELNHLRESALLKESELTDLIDQEKATQEEYHTQIEKFRLRDEEKEHVIKALREELKWSQKQIDDLSPKAEQLVETLEDLNMLKESLNGEVSARQNLERQLHDTEQKLSEKENTNEALHAQCEMVQVQLDDVMSNSREVEELNTSFKEMEDMYSTRSEELAQCNDSLMTRETQVESLRADLIEKTSAYEELQGILQTKDQETRQITLLLEQEQKTLSEKNDLIEELSRQMKQEQEGVTSLYEEISKVNESLAGKTSECDSLSEQLEHIVVENEELRKTEELYNHQKQEFYSINQKLNENHDLLTRLKTDHNKMFADLIDLIGQFGHEALGDDLQEYLELGHTESVLDALKSMVEESVTQMDRFKILSEEKEQESLELIAENTELLKKIENMQNEITLLNETIDDKDEKVRLVKEMLEAESNDASMNNIEDDEVGAAKDEGSDCGDGWNDAEGWDPIDPLMDAVVAVPAGPADASTPLDESIKEFTNVNNVSAAELQKYKVELELVKKELEEKAGELWNADEEIHKLKEELEEMTEHCEERDETINKLDTMAEEKDAMVAKLEKTIASLQENISKMKDGCNEKEAAMSKLEEEMKQAASERDASHEKEAGDVEQLKADLQKLKEEKLGKETTIAKLKLKLKQTMKGRDQLKENLQSELDRLSTEKDLIFNEFSEKLQQQNTELEELRNGSSIFSKTLEAVGGECNEKKKELEALQSSFNSTIESMETTSAAYNKLKSKYDELVGEKDELDISIKEHEELVKKLENELCDKDYQVADVTQQLARYI